MNVALTREELAEYVKSAEGARVGFVPTMGALHRGHLSLVERAGRENDVVVVSVFVNPTQFNDANDLLHYPRTPQADLAMLEKAGVDVVFMPSVEEVYPEPDTRVFDFGQTDKVMEGATRPGHFNGVAQVVSRLFNLVNPDRAYFGEKDFQQVAVIRAMVEQLGYPIEIVTCPTVREQDGLAMSSRNQLLDEAHRKAAPQIYAAMAEGVKIAQGAIAAAGRNPEEVPGPREVERFVAERINAGGLLEVIYFKIVNARTLADAQSWDEPDGIQGCAAVKAGNVRLIDNIRFV